MTELTDCQKDAITLSFKQKTGHDNYVITEDIYCRERDQRIVRVEDLSNKYFCAYFVV